MHPLTRRWQRLLFLLAACSALAATAGCGGTYATRMEKNSADLKAGTRNPGGGGAPGVSGLLYPGMYEIVDTQGQRTGVTINLPKSFLSPEGAPLFTIERNTHELVLDNPGETTLMVTYYADPSGKRLPAILSYSKVKIPVQVPEDQAKADDLLTRGYDAPPGITEFTSAQAKWRKTSVDVELNLPVDSFAGALQAVPGRNDRYIMMTSSETIMFQAIAPVGAPDNFFNAVEAAVKTVRPDAPAVTGGIIK